MWYRCRCRYSFRVIRRNFFKISRNRYTFIYKPIYCLSSICWYWFREIWLNWHIFIIGRRIWWLYCVVAFRDDDDDFVPIRMYVIFFLVFLLSITALNLDVDILTSHTSYWLKNAFHLSFSTLIDVFPLIIFWRIRPHVFIIDKKTHSSSLNNLHTLPIPLSDMLY